MRASIVHHLLSGQAWFSAGAVLILLLGAEALGWRPRRAWSLPAGRVALLLALGVAALSGTPVPWWLLAILAVTFALVIATGFRTGPAPAGRISAAAALCAVVAALAVEAPWHRNPRLAMPRGGSVAVLGDSISSGGFGESAPWPARLGALRGVRVANLALPGETLRSAVRFQLPRLATLPPPRLVLLELGGNDLLEGRSAAAFEGDLDALLSAVREATPAPVAMFELPLPPGRWTLGAAQRRVARSRGVALIPKRALTRVLTDPRFVDDGLHLTDAGHAELARAVARP